MISQTHIECLVCQGPLEENRYKSPFFFDFCFRCYGSFCRRVQRHAQRARKVGTYSKLSPSEVIDLIRRLNFSCQHCGDTLQLSGEGRENYLSIDHDYPLHCGGINHISNVVILCRICHSKKDNAKEDSSIIWNDHIVGKLNNFSFGSFVSIPGFANLADKIKQI